MDFENIIYTVEDGIATIKLNRPKALNALNSAINQDIMAAINLVKADPSVRVLIMTGSERAFAAGADVKEMAEATPRYAREFCGLAIDINPDQNPQVRADGTVLVGSKWEPGVNPYSISRDSDVVKAFGAHGWNWGAAFSTKDYMHFDFYSY